MNDRLVVEISGALPETNKYAVLAATQVLADALASELKQTHQIEATVSVRAVRPGKKGNTVAPAAVVEIQKQHAEAAD